MNNRLVSVSSWGGERGGSVVSNFALTIRVYYIVLFELQDGWAVARVAFKMRIRKPQRQLQMYQRPYLLFFNSVP